MRAAHMMRTGEALRPRDMGRMKTSQPHHLSQSGARDRRQGGRLTAWAGRRRTRIGSKAPRALGGIFCNPVKHG